MPLPDESLGELTSLTWVVLAQQGVAEAHEEMTRIAVRALPPAEGASITTFVDGRATASAASDAWARDLDEMQYAEREGPCLDAARTGNTFRIRDLTDEHRWPFYVPRAVRAGARSMVSLPLAAEGRLIGALNLYSRSTDAFDAELVSAAEVIAAHVGLATQVAASFFANRDLAEQLRAAMESRAMIEQAKGIVMGARGCDEDEAFEALRTASQRRNVKLRDVAHEVVAARSPKPLD